MKLILIVLAFLLQIQISICQDIYKLFEKINKNTVKFNRVAADIAWEASVNPGNPNLPARAANYQGKRILWQHSTCDKLVTLNNGQLLNNTQRRQTYLLCRGPIYTYDEAREMSSLYEELQSIYSDVEICIPTIKIITKHNLKELEDAILKYISTVKQYLNIKYNDILLAAKIAANSNLNKENTLCLNGDDDLDKLMKFSRNEEVLKWIWLVWREKVGPPMKEPYRNLVVVENRAAKRNAYTDIGASWRDELEAPNLRQLCRQLYNDIKPLYSLLHGVTRFFLRKKYGDIVPELGPIPAHLLGNLWAQNWEPLSDLIVPRTINLDDRIKTLNWTVLHMTKRADDFYQSMGLPAMTDSFWRKSVFSRENPDTRCHGTAADMYKTGDYRLLYCSGTTFEDFYVLHHEMGHIQYYMAYEQQPGIFRQANTAFHETIGDTIMLGVMTPQHLHRLGLVNDSVLYTLNRVGDDDDIDFDYVINDDLGIIENKRNTKVFETNEFKSKTNDSQNQSNKRKTHEEYKSKTNDNLESYEGQTDKGNQDLKVEVSTDDILILKQALNKLPQIPFSLVIDEYRWKYFEGKLDTDSVNKEFWDMALELQGIVPPIERGEQYFDVGAKFHVPDNTPYIRYFLASFLQHQLFESLCKAAVFGRRGVNEDLPDTITMNRCDIYGSKAAGKLLKDFMTRGNSQHWHEILQATIGDNKITASALKRYYKPLYKLLTRLVKVYRIPIGW